MNSLTYQIAEEIAAVKVLDVTPKCILISYDDWADICREFDVCPAFQLHPKPTLFGLPVYRSSELGVGRAPKFVLGVSKP